MRDPCRSCSNEPLDYCTWIGSVVHGDPLQSCTCGPDDSPSARTAQGITPGLDPAAFQNMRVFSTRRRVSRDERMRQPAASFTQVSR